MDEELLNANVAVGASTASASSSKKGPAKAKGQESPRSVAHKKLGGFFFVVVMVCYDGREAFMNTFAHCDQTCIIIYNICLYRHCTVLSI